MKNSFLLIILAFVLVNNNIAAQEKNSYSIQPFQAGTISLQTGKSVQVFLNDNVKEVLANANAGASYYIVFTSVNNTPLPSVSNKNNIGFTVLFKSTNDEKANAFTVDYIVFVKKKMQQMSLSKINTSAAIQH